ncbi:hypothetical protein [Gimesia sp.]|uniref:hypothetical protein n=1 Tax=Gimesia sp. TaxID=2024833 RepID=UPI003A956F93
MTHYKKRYLISDMGVFHLMTKNIRWVEIPYTMPVLEAGELIEFSELSDAEAFVAERLSEGSHIQAI